MTTTPTPDPPPPPPPRTPSADDRIFAEAERIRADVESPARRDPMEAMSTLPSAVATTGGPVVFPSGEGRAGGASPAPGAVSESFSLPVPVVPPWVPARRRLAELGVGPLYDALPPYPPGLDRSRRAAWRMAHKPIP